MRRSLWASRNRILAIGASLLISGSALAAAAMPAQAAALPVNTVVVANPGPQATNPIATAVVPITATESDETAPLTFSVTSSVSADPFTISQPPAVGDATVDLTGAFTAAYSGEVTVTATAAATLASSGGTDSVTFAWTAADNTITFPSPVAQATKLGTPVAGPTITATDSGGAAALPLTYSSTTLPTGLAINATSGLISGTPTAEGTYPVTVTATDQTGATGTSAFNWVITPNTLVVKATAPKTSYAGIKVSVQPTATDSAAGQNTQLTWSATGLPAGLTINAGTGLISGKPTKPSAATTTVTATDALGTKGSTKIVWHIAAPIIVSNGGTATTTAGHDVVFKLAYTDAVRGDKVTWTAAGLPAGTGFQQSSLMLYGWPAKAGTYHVTFNAKGSLGTSDQKKLTLRVKAAPDKGATGQIHFQLDGKCLQDPGNRTSNGTRVAIENCASGATERWTVASDNTIRVNGRCLNISGTAGASGKQLQLWSCNGGTRETWAQGSDGELVNPAAGLCVTDPGSSKKNGTTPTMGGCRAKSYEQWTLPAQPILTSVGGSCADDPLGKGSNGTRVDMFSCNGTPGQAWNFAPDGTIRISQYPKVCLTVSGSKIELYLCSSGNKSQKWAVVRTAAMTSELRLGGVCVGIKSLTAGNTTPLVTAKCTASDPRDLWHIA